MKNSRIDLEAVIDAILQEARTNRSFAAMLEQAASGIGHQRIETAPQAAYKNHARRRNRRTPGVLDPFALFMLGEVPLRNALRPLTIDQLRDIVSEHGMDTARLALKWKDPARLIDLIVDSVRSRSRKGDAFRAEKAPTSPLESFQAGLKHGQGPAPNAGQDLETKPEIKTGGKAMGEADIAKLIKITVSGEGDGMCFQKNGPDSGVYMWLSVRNHCPFPIEIDRIVGKIVVGAPIAPLSHLKRERIDAHSETQIFLEAVLSSEAVQKIEFQKTQQPNPRVGLDFTAYAVAPALTATLVRELTTGNYRFNNFA